MIGAILFAVILYVITTELWLFVTRQSRRAVLRRIKAAHYDLPPLPVHPRIRPIEAAEETARHWM
jgi:uncharacterized membrane protein